VDLPILPLAVTMMAGPQEMTAIVFVTHRAAVHVGGFVIGAAVAMVVGTTVTYLLAGAIDLGNSTDKGSTGGIIQYALVALLVVLAIRTYRHREHVEPPK
jgi:small neutral amino acid transporter SnatA (MarC family)